MIARALALATVVALALACEPPRRDVLSTPRPIVTVIDSCAAAFGLGAVGAACRGFTMCARPEGPCCVATRVCSGGFVFADRRCDGCPPECMSDLDCGPAAWCVGERCMPCPHPPGATPLDFCAPCPRGQVHLRRNGCFTCECGPPSECEDPLDCAPAGLCAQGASCAGGCDRLDCCANVCTDDMRCLAERVPLGCATGCPTPEVCPYACVTVRCACRMDGVWECDAECPSAPDGMVAPPTCGYMPR